MAMGACVRQVRFRAGEHSPTRALDHDDPIQVTMDPDLSDPEQRQVTNTLVGCACRPLVSGFNISLPSVHDDDSGRGLEAARLDGASETRAFVSIVLPDVEPILAVFGVLTFISGWNSFLCVDHATYQKHTPCRSGSRSQQAAGLNPPLQMPAPR